MAPGAGMEEPSLWPAGVLGLAFQAWAPGRQYSSTAGTKEPSLWAAEFWILIAGTVFSGAAAGSGEPRQLACTFYYPWSSGSYGSCLYRGASFPGVSGQRY
jgi:hypothetical protein